MSNNSQKISTEDAAAKRKRESKASHSAEDGRGGAKRTLKPAPSLSSCLDQGHEHAREKAISILQKWSRLATKKRTDRINKACFHELEESKVASVQLQDDPGRKDPIPQLNEESVALLKLLRGGCSVGAATGSSSAAAAGHHVGPVRGIHNPYAMPKGTLQRGGVWIKSSFHVHSHEGTTLPAIHDDSDNVLRCYQNNFRCLNMVANDDFVDVEEYQEQAGILDMLVFGGVEYRLENGSGPHISFLKGNPLIATSCHPGLPIVQELSKTEKQELKGLKAKKGIVSDVNPFSTAGGLELSEEEEHRYKELKGVNDVHENDENHESGEALKSYKGQTGLFEVMAIVRFVVFTRFQSRNNNNNNNNNKPARDSTHTPTHHNRTTLQTRPTSDRRRRVFDSWRLQTGGSDQ